MKKADTTVQVRVNSEDKKRAAEILDHLGMDISTAVNLLLKQIIIHEGLPFALTTVKSIENSQENVRSGENAENV